MGSLSHTPEVLYGDTLKRQRIYAELAETYAGQGNVFAAVHAAYASDVQAVQAVMWEKVMASSPNPDEQFFIVATAVAKALANHFTTASTETQDALEVVEAARRGMEEAFDEAAQKVISNKYLPIEFLSGLPCPTPADGESLRAARLQGQTPEKAASERFRTARDSMKVALRMKEQGREADAIAQAWVADWATVEGYLLKASSVVGDRSLVTMLMRWDLVVQHMSRMSAIPDSFDRAVEFVRGNFKDSLGYVEGTRLSRVFEPTS